MTDLNNAEVSGKVIYFQQVVAKSGNLFSKFTVEIDEGRKYPTRVNVVDFDNNTNLLDGTQVTVRGRIGVNSWTGPDGRKNKFVQIVAKEVIPDGLKSETTYEPQTDEEDIPF